MRCKLTLPEAAQPLLSSFSVAFSPETFQRFLVLLIGATLSLGRRTVCACLWTVRSLVSGHPSSYHRVFSHAAWSPWPLGKVLAAAVLELVPGDGRVIVTVDDTVAMHKGKRVYGKAKHHDACRSTHSHIVWKWGHKWVVLAVHVTFPFRSRAWALPVLMALYRPADLDQQEHRRHKTAPVLARQLAAVLLHWFPRRRFILLGDGGYASHELAGFCHRHRRHLTLVSRFHPQANLYQVPQHRKSPRGGRPRVKGARLAKPQEAVKTAQARRSTVNWYGGKTRQVELIEGQGHWYKAGDGLVPVRWVFVHDVEGTHRDEYFYSTDPTLSARQIVSLYTARWGIEVTFQEVRRHLGFETTRQWKEQSVLRAGPCLLGLFSVVCLIYARHLRDHRRKVSVLATAWYDKQEPTFSDALACVRRLFWEQTVFPRLAPHQGLEKLPSQLRETLLQCLSRAA